METTATRDSVYEPIETVATGRMSRVVRAEHRETDRTVALKVLHDHLADEEAVRDRLTREFAAVRRLDHPAIVGARELIEIDGAPALVMEYIDGESVRDRVERDGAMDWEKARRVIDDVLAGLEVAHDAGVWHRDLSAEHVLIDQEGNGRIVGFGLARVDELVALTMHTQTLGALEAMAPERVLGMDYDGRADLYSVGAVAWEMLIGHPLVDGTMQSAFRHAEDDRVVDEIPDDLPEEARYVLERSLVGDVSARFATAGQMRRALDGVYDRQMWAGWAGRDVRSCPDCEMPIIDGVAECVYCDHEIRRLVRHPGMGDWSIRIIPPRADFDPDVWFEKNTEPEYLPSGTFDELIELLDSYDDIRSVVEWTPEYRLPPYVLFDGLTRDDAGRVSELLEERSIPHEVEEDVPGLWARLTGRIRQILRIDETREWSRESHRDWMEAQDEMNLEAGPVLDPLQRDELDEDSGYTRGAWGQVIAKDANVRRQINQPLGAGWSVFFAPILLLTSLNARHGWLAVGLVAALAALGGLGWWWELYGRTVFWVGLGIAVGGMASIRLAGGLLRRQLSLTRDRPQIRGFPVMVPAGRLRRLEMTGSFVELPERTGRVLEGLDSDGVRRDVHELLVLAVGVARRVESIDGDRFTDIVEEVLSIGEQLDDVETRQGERNTAVIYGELQDLDRRLEEADGDREAELRERRVELLDQLEDHDRLVSRSTLLRSGLQKSRGMLMDILSAGDLDDASREVVLKFGDDIEEALVEVETRLEAAREVEAL